MASFNIPTSDNGNIDDLPVPNASNIAELSKPVKKVEEKWKLLPYFLRLRGLMRQVFIHSLLIIIHYLFLIILLIAY